MGRWGRRLAMAAVTAAMAMLAPAEHAEADVREGLAAYRTGDYTTAWRELAHAARKTMDPDAMYILGLMARDGRGMPQDRIEAIKWFRLATGAGDGRAMLALARMHELGTMVRRDRDKAHTWFLLAASHLPTGSDRDAAVRGRDRTAYFMSGGQETKAAAEADRIAADLPGSAMAFRIQESLATLGYETGRVDGIVGPKTKAAIRAFQIQNGLKDTGKADADLQTRLVGEVMKLP